MILQSLFSVTETSCKNHNASGLIVKIDIVCRVTQQDQVCRSTLSICHRVCVCVPVGVCSLHIMLHYKNRFPASICAQCAGKLGKQGSPWPSVLLLPPASQNPVWRQEIGVRPQSEGHVAMVNTPMTFDLCSPPPPALSHHSPGLQTLSPESELEKWNGLTWPSPVRLRLTQPSTMDCAFWALCEWPIKNRWTLRKGSRGGGRKKGVL